MTSKVILIHPDAELRTKMLEDLRRRGVIADAFSSPQEARARTESDHLETDHPGTEMTVILASSSRNPRELFAVIDTLMDGGEGIESEYVR